MIDPDYHRDHASTGPLLQLLSDHHPGTGDKGWSVYGLSGSTDSELMTVWSRLRNEGWSTWMDGFQGGKRTIVLYRKDDGGDDPDYDPYLDDLDGPITDDWLLSVGAKNVSYGSRQYLRIGHIETAIIDGLREWIACGDGPADAVMIPHLLKPSSRSSVLALVQYIEDNHEH